MSGSRLSTRGASASVAVPDPLFASAHQALLFAYTFAPNQYGVAAAAERTIMMFGRERYESMRARGRGLSGLDGAAQAGMIKACVTRLPGDARRAAIEARFAILDRRAQARAVLRLALRVRDRLSDRNLCLAIRLVQRHYVGKVDLRALVDEFGLTQRTIVRRWVRARGDLEQLDADAMARLECAFEVAGIVAPAHGFDR